MIRTSLIALCVVLLGASFPVIAAEQPGKKGEPVKQEQPRQTKLRKLIDESIHWYELLPDIDSTDPMEPITILRWPNQTRGTADGATVIWVADGRPEAVAAIFPWERKVFSLEFDSLSRGKLVAKRDGELVWQPEESGLEFRAIPDAPVPAGTRAARQRQMKVLAKQFHTTLVGWKPDGSQREELRMLPRPLYRYRIAQPGKLLDGSLIAFVSGTDPESILLIEAFRVGRKYQWQYAFVRRTSGALEGRFREKVVWTCKKYPPTKNPRSTHIVFSRPLESVLPPEE